nr:phenylalanine--tRNA ligase beta subunit-related protein [Streptomyces sp. HNM0574]
MPSIAAWRAAYTECGTSASRYPCAAESLLRRVAKSGALPRINTLVDLCNAVSLRHALPVAACSLAEITGPLAVRRADGSERYLPLGSPDTPEHPSPGEVIYADAEGGAHSRRWNWRQSHGIATMPGPARPVLLTVEGVHPGAGDDVAAALGELVEALGRLTPRPLVEGVRTLGGGVLSTREGAG